MSVTAAKPYVQKAYDEIKVIVNDANKQIRNFNLNTIAKIIAIVAVFTLGGAFGIFACLKMGIAADIAALVTFPFLVGVALTVNNFLNNNVSNKDQFIKNLNDDINEKLKYPRSIKDAVSLNDGFLSLSNNDLVSSSGGFTISKIPLNSLAEAKKKYENDIRRHLPGFLQFPKPHKDVIFFTKMLGLVTLSMVTIQHFVPKKV